MIDRSGEERRKARNWGGKEEWREKRNESEQTSEDKRRTRSTDSQQHASANEREKKKLFVSVPPSGP